MLISQDGPGECSIGVGRSVIQREKLSLLPRAPRIQPSCSHATGLILQCSMQNAVYLF